MARRGNRPGRTLLLGLAAIALIYAALAWNGQWQPRLGLDLQGGTRITLEAATASGEAVTPDKLAEAAGIIDNRVNASGVAESEVSTQSDDQIIVEIPGEQRRELVDAVTQTAQLRFRLVAGQPQLGAPLPQPSPGPTGTGSPAPSPSPSATGQRPGASGAPKPGATAEPSPAGRAVSQGLLGADSSATPKPSPSRTAQPEATGTAQPEATGTAQPEATGTAQPSPDPAPAAQVPTDESSVAEMLAWTRNPDQRSLQRFARFTCEEAEQVEDDPAKPLLACDENGLKYLLSPALIEGTQLDDASYGIPQTQVQYVVNLDFDGTATDTFGEVTRTIVGTGEQFAIVLDGVVISAPEVTGAITDGNAQITGDFTQAEAQSLANSLKYGALPLSFEVLDVTEEGPTLAADQLQAGLLAGGIGLLLVLVYCFFYYRGLGVVIFASLVVAAALTYAAVLFLSETAGFSLTLPGIAGLIVGVGITADSFIVYFERLRDELRDGKSLRVAVEAGWVRARTTCLAADAVSLLAAVVLFFFAIGVVKGFAFALGVSTVIDLVVFFLFTKPMVTWLARFSFFRSGHRLSGLGPEHIGMVRRPDPAGVAAGPVAGGAA